MYTHEMKELIKIVEETRPLRMGQEFPRMNAAEKEAVLNKFHPDYVKEGFAPLSIGNNKGEKVPRELAALLEARSRIEGVEIDLKNWDYDTDVLIIGGGGAAAAAALMAAGQGVNVIMVTKLRFGDGNTVMAQGGIQAATLPQDSPPIHYLDALGGGHFTNDPRLIYNLVQDGPMVIRWLEGLGVMFDKEDGKLLPVHGGGTSRKRMHAARDYSGAEIMRILKDEVLNKGIRVIEFSPAVELVLDEDGKAAGAVLYNLETGQYAVARAKTVVLAVGGSGRLHYQGFPTTNHFGATADGLVMAYRAGCSLKFMDTIQYHPTGAAYPPQVLGLLVTEKLRSMGATPLNVRGEVFVHHLETRDVEAAAIIRECRERKLGIKTPTGMVGVWLDTPLLELLHGAGTLEKHFPAMLRQFGRFGIDFRRYPILIYPTLHYQNGGIAIDEHGRTEIENLFAAGENTGGVHGRNRLAGNSLLDIMVFGRRAGLSASQKAGEVKLKKLTLSHVDDYHRQLEKAGVDTDNRVSPMVLPVYTHREA